MVAVVSGSGLGRILLFFATTSVVAFDSAITNISPQTKDVIWNSRSANGARTFRCRFRTTSATCSFRHCARCRRSTSASPVEKGNGKFEGVL